MMQSSTVTRMLDHFRWDAEKLMESIYDGDQAKLFSESQMNAHHSFDKDSAQVENTKPAAVEEFCKVGYRPI